MTTNPEALLNRLVLFAACAGEQGCPVTRLLSSVLLLLSITECAASGDEIFRILEDPASSAHRSVAVVWQWITARQDVSIGENRMFNDMPFVEILLMACKPGTTPALVEQGSSRQKAPSRPILTVHVSEATMWESLTGHGIDHKRIPRSEWILLQGISSTTSNGILQGDLGRLVGQDKRSVPKRTNCLVEKGYITKRTTLVRGTKTSKLWLKSLAPSTAEDSGARNDSDTDITLSRHFLVDTLEPVPWRSRWTGESIDYRVLATTIMATCKAWNVMRVQDLKSKLGVLGMTWQMKVVSKTCRFLNARGTIQYVAAKLNNRIFKDCIRFNRDMNARDWSIFLATGKRTARTAKSALQESREDDSGLSLSARNKSRARLLYCPAWTIYIPMISLVTIYIRESGDEGVTNPELCAMTIGSSFTRYIAGLTASISSEHIQPRNVAHLAIKSDRGRPGKSPSLYWYSMADTQAEKRAVAAIHDQEMSEPEATSKALAQDKQYGFGHALGRDNSSSQWIKLSELCLFGLSRKRKRGRLKVSKMEDQITESNLPSESCSRQKKHVIAQVQTRVLGRSTRKTRSTMGTEGLVNGDDSMIPSESIIGTEGRAEGTADATADALTVSTRNHQNNRNNDLISQTPAKSSARSSGNRQFKCETCSGSWKNGLGLKYHLEKSKTSCNPSFNPQLMTSAKAKAGSAAKELPRKSATRGKNSFHGHGAFADRASSGADAATRISTVDSERVSGKARPKLRCLEMTPSMNSERPIMTEMTTVVTGQALLLSTESAVPPRQVDPFAKLVPQHTRYKNHSSLEDANTTESSQIVSGILPNAPSDSKTVVSPWLDSSLALTDATRDGPMHSILDRQAVMDGIMELLHAYNGAIPAGEVLKSLVQKKFQLRDEISPDGEMIKSAMQQLIREKMVVDQWHAFRASDGQIGKCQIITTRSVATFAPETRLLVERIRRLYPAPILPEQLPEPSQTFEIDSGPSNMEESGIAKNRRLENKIGGRGRRSLASGVATLDAPVYAAQTCTKRAMEPKDSTEPPRKRRRRGDALDVSSNSSLPFSYENSLTVPSSPWNSTGDAAGCSKNVGITLDILFPKQENRRDELLKAGTAFWAPGAASDVFNRFARSMQHRGWIPGSDWFSWGSCHPVRPGKAHRSRPDFNLLLKDCLAIELEADEAIEPPTEKHSTFLNFMGGDAGNHFGIFTVQWSKSNRRQETVPTPVNDDDDDSESDFSPATGNGQVDARMKAIAADVSKTGVTDSDIETSHHQLLPSSFTRQAALASRNLTALPSSEIEDASFVEPCSKFDSNELVTAFVAIRCLLGGLEKAIDWGLMVNIFPTLSLAYLRRFWAKIRKDKASFISKATEKFQDTLLIAIENDEISLPNYERLLDYDWKGLIQWAMHRQDQEQIHLPGSRERLDRDFQLEDRNTNLEDWREKFFHPQSSVFSRFEALTLQPGTLTATEVKQVRGPVPVLSSVTIARSWIRSLCCTSETDYTPQDVKARLRNLSDGTLQQSNAVLKAAIDQLTLEKVICKSKRTALGGRPYRFSEGYTSILAKVAHRQKFADAISFKGELDLAFGGSQSMKIPYALSDGAVMALTNLMAAGRLRITTLAVPNIPFGFEPGNYECRKYPKSYYHLDLQAEPTESYLFNDWIETIHASQQLGPPREGTGREIPQWIDFFGRLDDQRWADILGGFCFALNTRGLMSIEGICDAMSPVLEPFEARLIVSWGLESGVLTLQDDGISITLGEWWWLVSQGPWS